MSTKGRPDFHVDQRGRVPFALVAVTILIGVTVLTAITTQLQRSIEDDALVMDEGERNVRFEDEVEEIAWDVATRTLSDGFAEGVTMEDLVHTLNEDFIEEFDISMGKHDAWSFVLHDHELAIDVSGSGLAGKVVGQVNWSATSPSDGAYRRNTIVSRELDRPYGLLIMAMSDVQVSGDEGDDLARLIRYMLYKLAIVRVGNGEIVGDEVISRQDGAMALELALDLYLRGPSMGDMGRWPGSMVNTSASTGADPPLDPADLFLENMGIRTVRSSAIMSQYIMGLLDHYLLWFRDYSGIGEGVGSFFEWAGTGLGGDPEDEEAWWNEFKVRDMVERWAFRILSAILRTVLEMQGTEYIDVRDLDLDELASEVSRAVNGTDMDGAGTDHGDLSSPVELQEAMEELPEEMEGAGLIEKVQQALVVAAMDGIGLLVEGARSSAVRAWSDMATADRLHGISVDMPEAFVPVLDGRGAGNGQFSIVDAFMDLGEMDYEVSIGTKGIHHTAPEARLQVPFEDVRPYETDFRIDIDGDYSVDRFVYLRKGASSGLGSVEAVNISLTVPINITFTIPVFSGVPFVGVDYDPSDTLFGDMVEIVWEFINRTWEGLQWIAGGINHLFSSVVDGIKELGRRGIDNLGQMSAAAFSRTVEKLLKAVYNRAWNDAMNHTWLFLGKLIGDDLKDMLTFHVDILGFRLTVEIDLFRQVLTVSHVTEGRGFALMFKRLADDTPPFELRPVEGFAYSLFATGFLDRGGLHVEAVVDPLTVVYPSVVHVFGESRGPDGKGLRFELDAPVARRTYKVYEASISSVSGSPVRGIPIPGTGLSVDLDAGLRVKYGTGIKDPERLLVKAVRGAWYTTLKGYSVKELYGELGDPDLLEAFIIQLLNNVVNSIGDSFSRELPELEVFLDGEISAGNGVVSSGFSLSFVIKDPVHVLMELVPWFVDNLRAFILRMTGHGMPTGFVALPSKVSENLFVRGTAYSKVGAPDVLGGKRTGEIKLAGVLEANLPALAALIGADHGRWMVHTGIVIPDLPSRTAALIPGFNAPRPRCDLWIVELKVMEIENDGALITEVYYDTSGRDNEEEFIEIWNPTRGRIDLSRWVLEDNGGRWRLPDHLSIPANGRIIVARDKEGIRSAFGRHPDVSGLPLNLNNDGDSISLLDPYGIEIDRVAWEGGLHGWDTACVEGESLQMASTDDHGPNGWSCTDPNPWR